MKAILAFTCIILFSFNTLAANFRQEDKQKHAVYSAGLSSVSYAAFRSAKYSVASSMLLSMTLALGVGHLKESSDPFYDHEDMQANAAGAGVGLILPLYIEF